MFLLQDLGRFGVCGKESQVSGHCSSQLLVLFMAGLAHFQFSRVLQPMRIPWERASPWMCRSLVGFGGRKSKCCRISWARPMFPQQHPCLCVKPLLIRFRQEMLGFVVLSCNSRRKGEFGAMPEGFRLTQQGQVSGGGIAKCGFVTYLCHSTV